MKKLVILFFPLFIYSQSDTEIYLFDISKQKNEWTISNGKNISKNEGYDSQPHFYNNNIILFSSTRNKQTDIAKYTISDNKLSYLNNTPNGGEYSPQKIPNSKNISAVRLDTDGKQRFYEYNFKTGKSNELINKLVVAYPLWYNKKTIISSVIVNDSLELVITNLKTNKNITISKNVGRSFHKIPKSKLISFMKKNKENWEVWSLNPKTFKTKLILPTKGNQDICWLPNGTMLIANKTKILKFSPKKDSYPKLFYDFSHLKIKSISRITSNKKGTQLAITAE